MRKEYGGWEFSAASCRGLIEAMATMDRGRGMSSFPRLHAAASLKLADAVADLEEELVFSAASCRGLIEASHGEWTFRPGGWFSAASCRGLIEALLPAGWRLLSRDVFRGFMPRPH